MTDEEKYPTVSIRVSFPKCETEQSNIRFITTLDEIVITHLPLFCKAVLAVNKEIAAMKGEDV